MRKHILFMLNILIIPALLLTGCAKEARVGVNVMLGLSWFMSYDDVKNSLKNYELLEERESVTGNEKQYMLDYTAVSLFDIDCDLTLCFTDNGLVGFNYHDIEKNKDYRSWFSTLESNYGYPTEESSGMSAWYKNPIGRNTTVYLFNLEEGVQTSFYISVNTPDRSYSYSEDVFIPSPELRTPVVPLDNDKLGASSKKQNTEALSDTTTDSKKSTASKRYSVSAYSENTVTSGITVESENSDSSREKSTDSKKNTMSSASDKNTSSAKTNSQPATSSTTTTSSQPAISSITSSVPQNSNPADEHNELGFYGSPDTERSKITSYTQSNEYRNDVPGQPWEQIMEFTGKTYGGKKCDTVLCFTSLGLVGINYIAPDTSDYSYWREYLINLYGIPTDTQYKYTVWDNNRLGAGTVIYIFELDDCIQISFFADDTGSELS